MKTLKRIIITGVLAGCMAGPCLGMESNKTNDGQKAAEGWRLQGKKAFRKGLFEKAFQCYTEGLKFDPADARLHFNQGLAIYKAAETSDNPSFYKDKAQGCFFRAIDKDHRHLKAHFLFAKTTLEMDEELENDSSLVNASVSIYCAIYLFASAFTKDPTKNLAKQRKELQKKSAETKDFFTMKEYFCKIHTAAKERLSNNCPPTSDKNKLRLQELCLTLETVDREGIPESFSEKLSSQKTKVFTATDILEIIPLVKEGKLQDALEACYQLTEKEPLLCGSLGNVVVEIIRCHIEGSIRSKESQ